MSKIKIVCTSTGCIEYAPERYRGLNIDILRMRVKYDGQEHLEGPDLDPAHYYNYLETVKEPKKNLPRTSTPATEEVQDCFARALAEGYDEVMVFTISTGLSTTYNMVNVVAKDFEGKLKIHVIDTKITCFNEGFLAVRAAQMAEQGMPSEQILKEIEWMKRHQLLIGVDGKLDYLIYNGRLKGGKAFMGQLLKICPVVYFNEQGELVPLESVRTPKKALIRMCEEVKARIGDRDPKDYLLWHMYTGPSLIAQLREMEGSLGVQTNHEGVVMSPVSGAHNGPWLAGYSLVFLRREDEPLED
ncbi:MAG: DegV family protein [Ruminococcaceae bacterium]|nr:DegV family protein [Oscillospiraceae bacterium]